ncbi:MAG: bifunctional 4-hydroxy-3-methylbut-2-enyl diphosphate reductase/30S ribosomal protein S1 [Gudongella sp.]|nr:bifunctional 4-hydroxy-3-methylbut-2-enyl diphosphate reductase/30S ribosomal protein S1 [Gudongella sp.]
MEIIIAENAGFCSGVDRAVKMTEAELAKGGYVYSYGPLIHNKQAVDRLEKDGLITIDDYSEIDEGKIIVRAHGVSEKTIKNIEGTNLELIDSTCPYVKSVHKKVADYYKDGYQIVIIGDKDHAEVIGINGWCNDSAFIVNEASEAYELPNMQKSCVVSQTTNRLDKFLELSNIIDQKSEQMKLFNTICNATKLRQEACIEVSKQVDAMIVLGGKHSSNTIKLAEVSRKYCDNVYHIETIEELTLQDIQNFYKIGLTAGASTPDWIIEEAVKVMENYNNGEVNNGEVNKDEVNIDEVKNVEVNNDEVSNDEANKVEVNNDEVNKDEVNNDEVNKDEVNNDEANKNEMNNDEMMKAIDSSFKRISRGDVLKGIVLYVTNNEVMVNINFKSDGIIERSELPKGESTNPKDLYQVGDIIDVYVVKIDDGEGNVVLSAKRVEFIKDWEILEDTFKNEEVIEVEVQNAVKGGLTVLVNGVNGFMPASQISLSYVSDLNQFKGQKLQAKIIDFDIQKRRMILSRKAVEKVQTDKKRKALWETIEVGSMLEGVVQRLTDFGAFVDLGGIDGLIHISDLAWFRVKHPSDVLSEGEHVEVKVLAFDKEKNRISLGLKQTKEEPWKIFLNDYKVGDIVEGEVVNILDFGAFVRVIKGVDGLLHVSQISNEHIEKPSDVLSIGAKVMVKITEINEEDKKISLSAKEAVETENIEEKAKDSPEESEVAFSPTIGELTKEKTETEEKPEVNVEVAVEKEPEVEEEPKAVEEVETEIKLEAEENSEE